MATARTPEKIVVPKVCPKCSKPWHEKHQNLRYVLAVVFVVSGTLLLGRPRFYNGFNDVGVIDELAQSGALPIWIAQIMLAICALSFFGMAYFELIKTDRNYRCENCGFELHVPKRQWSLAAKALVSIVAIVLTFVAILVGIMALAVTGKI